MMYARTVVGQPVIMQMIDEAERQAYFAQSARTVDGERAEYRALEREDEN
jgi:hypothetical protein